MRRIAKFTSICLMTLGTAVSAETFTWSFDNTALTSSGTGALNNGTVSIEGSFDFDESTNTASNIDVTVTLNGTATRITNAVDPLGNYYLTLANNAQNGEPVLFFPMSQLVRSGSTATVGVYAGECWVNTPGTCNSNNYRYGTVSFAFTDPTAVQEEEDNSSYIPSIIRADISRINRGAINANTKLISDALNRFRNDRESGVPLAESVSSSGMSSFKIEPNVTPINNGQGLSLNGIFGGTTTDGTYRRVTFGEFDIQHEPGSGTTLNFNTRLAWERAAGDDAMLAYFVGAELNNSTISSTYTGTQSRYGVTAGMYGVKALGQNLYAAGYGSYGMARNNLNITDGTSDISGSYNTRSFGLGAQISGTIDQASYKIRPSVSLNFMQTWVGDVSLSSTAAGATSTIAASVGNTNTLELLATPEFLFPVEVGNSSDAKVTASVAPRLICERNYGAGAVTKKCGAGAQLGLNQVSADGSTNLNASIRLDRIGGVNRRGLNLQAELRF